MADSAPDKGDVFKLDRIRELIELMESGDLREVDLRQGNQRIQLKRGTQTEVVNVAAPAPIAMAPAAAAPVAAASAAAPAAAEEDPAHIQYVKSPMVGTFYSQPNPDAPNFVKVGDNVDASTTICIVEAMKVFNEIPAGISGKIVAILVDNEAPVEYDKPLFKIDTSQ